MGVAQELPMGRVTDWVSAMESPVQLVWGWDQASLPQVTSLLACVRESVPE